MKLFSVHDSKAEAFLTPFFSANNGTAMRSFLTAARDQKHIFHAHAADYNLFEIGMFDDVTGAIIGLNPINSLGNALQLTAVTNGKNTGLSEAEINQLEDEMEAVKF